MALQGCMGAAILVIAAVWPATASAKTGDRVSRVTVESQGCG
jgi:hypothetical protein